MGTNEKKEYFYKQKTYNYQSCNGFGFSLYVFLLFKYSYDKAGRISRAKTVVGTDKGKKTISVSYGYDADGNIISYMDEMGVKTTYEYDLADRVTAIYLSDVEFVDDNSDDSADIRVDILSEYEREQLEKARDGTSNANIVTKNVGGVNKKFIKGERLKYYPTGMPLYGLTLTVNIAKNAEVSLKFVGNTAQVTFAAEEKRNVLLKNISQICIKNNVYKLIN